MNLINKKNIKIYLLVICLIGLLSVLLITNKNTYSPSQLDSVKLKNTFKSNSGVAFMLETAVGSKNYETSESKKWPEGGFEFNEEKSGCIDESKDIIDGALTYDIETDTLTLKTRGNASCYLYFDMIPNNSIVLNSNIDMPKIGIYKADIACNDASGFYSNKYRRLEISGVNTSPNCSLTFAEDTSITTKLSDKVMEDATEITSTNNAGGSDISYRYQGKNPNNYIWFNDELWRIIGLIPTCLTESCGTPTTSLVKIIKNEPIGSYVSDADYTNTTGAWGENTLYHLLNEYYYGKGNGTIGVTDDLYCYGWYKEYYKTQADCDFSRIGISNDSNDYFGQMVKEVFWNTGVSNFMTNQSSIYKEETSKQTVSGYVGLMASSDYGYASSSSDIIMNSLDFSNTIKNNWMFTHAYQTLINQSSSNSKSSLYINVYGVLNSNSASDGYLIRPVVYLDENIYVISGTGEENNPYIVGMK